MIEYPMTFNEFVTRFDSEESCRDYLYQIRWEDGFICPKCGHNQAWTIEEYMLYTCKQCRHQTSVIAGTVFEDTRKPLKDWFVAIWWITTQKYGASTEGLKQVLGLKSDQTAWTWLHKIRSAMVSPERKSLSGTVEVDECYIGGEQSGGKRGRGSENKSLVLIATESEGKKLGRIRMQLITDASSMSLIRFIQENIILGSEIITDDWSGYSSLKIKGYKHTVFVQKKAKSEEEMLPHVHLAISLLKRWLLGTHQGAVTQKHLQAYLDEFVFRFNRRTSAKRGLLFYRLLENAMLVGHTTYRDFVDKMPLD
jgi:transposase-like protein